MCAGRYSIFSTALIALFAYGLVLHEHAQLINSFLPRVSFLNEPSSSREIDFFFLYIFAAINSFSGVYKVW